MDYRIITSFIGVGVVALAAVMPFAACGDSTSTSTSSSGGTSGTSSSGASSSSSGGAGLPAAAGYFTAVTEWKGYGFTFTDALGSTISPTCTETGGCDPALNSMCATGSVVADAAYQGVAGLGWQLSREATADAVAAAWTVSGSGINVTLSGAPTGARLQLQALNAASNSERYCAPIPAGGGLIKWADLKTYCWGDTANPSVSLKVGDPIGQAAIVVPGTATAAVPFDFCITAMSVAP